MPDWSESTMSLSPVWDSQLCTDSLVAALLLLLLFCRSSAAVYTGESTVWVVLSLFPESKALEC